LQVVNNAFLYGDLEELPPGFHNKKEAFGGHRLIVSMALVLVWFAS